MVDVANDSLRRFKENVTVRFQLYNSLFTSLPFDRIEKTGILLSLLSNNCDEGYTKGHSPIEIIEDFFNQYRKISNEKERIDLLFRLVQYVERQVVLFDALEDASYDRIHDLNGAGTVKQLLAEVVQNNKESDLRDVLNDFCVRLVLTAHPTQFYPGSVLGIIHDLCDALKTNDANAINNLLKQLGRTPFLKKVKPTPYDEAVSLIWFLENVFYTAAAEISAMLNDGYPGIIKKENALIQLGFWPGGDRDGNPFVNCAITLQVADALKSAILRCYYYDVRKLRRRLTFVGIEQQLAELEKRLYDAVFIPGNVKNINAYEIREVLEAVKTTIQENHSGLFISLVEDLINKTELFGTHFASLDIRQDSSVHEQIYGTLAGEGKLLPPDYSSKNEKEKIGLILNIAPLDADFLMDDEVLADTISIPGTIQSIQSSNGENGCNRYIISQCNSALNIIEVFGLFKLCGVKEEDMRVDIVPLFETIEDLENATAIMKKLYAIPAYKNHLKRRGFTQTIMLGFSDGTKDGGYLMANWSIYRAKEMLTKVSRENGFDVIFFDGRGGPPSRGGGKTHKFYASMGSHISNKEIQLTIQGQTISSNFGTTASARYNLEQLINAGVSNSLFANRHAALSPKSEELLQELSSYGFDAYKKLRDHQELPNYLYEVSPLPYYSETNIGSRPSKRGPAASSISLKGLRAIPFAGAWSQIKQNVPGFFGVGTALKKMEYIGRFDELKKLYTSSLYFKTLLDNCEMSMLKSYFPLTAYISEDERYGQLWKMIHDEFELTKEYILKLSGKKSLMADYPVDKMSIEMRERIVLPLLTIQQYALAKLRQTDADNSSLKDSYRKLVMRCSFGIINAGRNSA